MKRFLSLLAAMLVAPAAHAAPGINLAGCHVATSLCPNDADIDLYADKGFKLLRVGINDTTPTSSIEAVVDHARARGMVVILDRHQFKWPAVDEQVATWTRLIGKYRGAADVQIDLMNEPRGFNSTTVTNDWMQWALDTRAIIEHLYANGVTNTIVVEWPGSSAAFRMDKHESAKKPCESAACAVDRIGGLGSTNVIYGAHMYFDRGSSGTNKSCQPYLVLDTSRQIAAARGWRLLLGEAAFGSYAGVPTSCQTVGARAIAEISDHPETWEGVTWWGGGREWPLDYIFAVAPKKHTDNAYLNQLSGSSALH